MAPSSIPVNAVRSSSNPESMVRVLLRIHGRVQGVSFRYYARRRAASLGLAGWVRNCPDGSVESEAEGPEDAVQRFIDWARRGPSAAEVERVDVQRLTPEGYNLPFRIEG